MRANLRRVAMTGVLAVAGTSGIGVSAAKACDHGPADGFGPGPRWSYGGVANTPVRFGSLPDYDDCPVCQRRSFIPPACPPPPYCDEFSAVGTYRRVIYREYRRTEFPVAYPAPPAPYATSRAFPSYDAPYSPAPLPFPSKQAPGVYGTSQYPDPTSGPSAPYDVPQPQAPYPSQAPAADYGQVPPLPSPSVTPQQ